MGAKKITERKIIGTFYRRLEEKKNLGWVELISMFFESDQDKEEYAWLGQSPSMRKWVGKRHAKGLSEESITITNDDYESTMEIPVSWMRRDKTGQIQVRINEQVRKANTHWATLLSDLIKAGETTVCYDGQYFYDTDHAEGNSGTQSNIKSVDISALPVAVHGSATIPSPAEMQQCILQGAQEMLSFKDNQGDLMNEDASQFLVMVPTPLFIVAQAAVKTATIDGGDTNIINAAMDGFSFQIAANGRLNWTDQFTITRTDSEVKPFIRQEEVPVSVDVVGEGSELEFNDKVHHYGIWASRGVGYGYWQNSVLVKMT